MQADVFDPWADSAEAQHEYGNTPVQNPETGAYDAIIIAVAHHQFKAMGHRRHSSPGQAQPRAVRPEVPVTAGRQRFAPLVIR